jgi:hypothetical protein
MITRKVIVEPPMSRIAQNLPRIRHGR